MSNDSMELTFVRCPSCGSLGSAKSKTCKMCGANLDVGGGKSAEPEAERRSSSRVRQRTMSRPQEELSAAVNKIRDEMGASIQPGGLTAAVASTLPPELQGGPNIDDPLSAYIEEMDPDSSLHTEEPTQIPAADSGSFSPDSVEPEPFAGGSTPPEAARAEGVRGAPYGMETPSSSEPIVAKNGHDHDGRARSEGPSQRTRLQFGERREDRPNQRPDEARRGSARHEAPPPPPQPERRKEQERRPDSRDQRRETREEERSGFHRPPPVAGDDSSPRSYEVPRRNVNSGGRLAGWLVSYRETDGRAVELREGKFFISRTRVKDSDLVIDDKSVSTPHALCAIGNDTKMRLQDLMSDGGVYIRRRGESDFVRITETAELEHGDWVRFGDVEYNVCLIAHVGVK